MVKQDAVFGLGDIDQYPRAGIGAAHGPSEDKFTVVCAPLGDTEAVLAGVARVSEGCAEDVGEWDVVVFYFVSADVDDLEVGGAGLGVGMNDGEIILVWRSADVTEGVASVGRVVFVDSFDGAF